MTATLTTARGLRAGTAALEILLGLGAVYGTVGMWIGTLGMTSDWLAATGFASWFVPGLALLVVVGIPMLAAAALELRGQHGARLASVVAGVLQIGWIAVQLLVTQRYFVLQPVVLLVAAAILFLAAVRPGDGHG